MSVERLPFVQTIFESGPDDRVFDGLLLVGPPLILLIAVLGRSVVTMALASLYLGVFVAYSVYRGLR